MSNDQPVDGKCNASTSDGGFCANDPCEGRTRCYRHGGKTPTGPDSPHFVHGLRSSFLSDEDKEIYEAVRDEDPVDLVEEEMAFQKTKLLRAARETQGEDGAVELTNKLLEKIAENPEESVDDQTVAGLSKVLQLSSSSLDRTLHRFNELARTYHKMAEGDRVEVAHSGSIDGTRKVELDEDTAATIRQVLRVRRREGREVPEGFEDVENDEDDGNVGGEASD